MQAWAALLADQGGGGAEAEAGGAPQRRQQAGPHPALDQDGVEPRQVLVLLRLHVGDLGQAAAGGGAGAQHRALAAVDRAGRQLAGVVDPQHLVQPRLGGAEAGRGGR